MTTTIKIIGNRYLTSWSYLPRYLLQEALDEFNQELAYNPSYVSAYDQIEDIKRQNRAGALQDLPR